MARARRKPQEGPQRDPAKVLFLALNMILLAFFILLVALSQPDKTREAELRMEVRKAFQSFGGSFLGLGRYVEETGLSREQTPETTAQRIETFLGELSRFVEENEPDKAISYEITSEGMTVHVSERFAFEPGSAELKELVRPVFDNLFNLMLRTTNPVRIEGHTDNAPVTGDRYPNGWVLAAQRANTVFRLFTASGQLPPARFTVVGYGAQRPLASNLTAEGRARNRRVSVTFLGKLRPVGGG